MNFHLCVKKMCVQKLPWNKEERKKSIIFTSTLHRKKLDWKWVFTVEKLNELFGDTSCVLVNWKYFPNYPARVREKKDESARKGKSTCRRKPRWKAHLPFELRCRVACVGRKRVKKLTVKKKKQKREKCCSISGQFSHRTKKISRISPWCWLSEQTNDN